MWKRIHETHKTLRIADPWKAMKCSTRLTFPVACYVFVTKAPTSRIWPLSGADIKYWWSYTSTPPHAAMGLWFHQFVSDECERCKFLSSVWRKYVLTEWATCRRKLYSIFNAYKEHLNFRARNFASVLSNIPSTFTAFRAWHVFTYEARKIRNWNLCCDTECII